MSIPVSQGKLSVIVAGATGSTGREIVTRLVAHPDVGRVVALSRYPIPVNRWHSFFPNLRTADALKHLSVVAVDWSKLHDETSGITMEALSTDMPLILSKYASELQSATASASNGNGNSPADSSTSSNNGNVSSNTNNANPVSTSSREGDPSEYQWAKPTLLSRSPLRTKLAWERYQTLFGAHKGLGGKNPKGDGSSAASSRSPSAMELDNADDDIDLGVNVTSVSDPPAATTDQGTLITSILQSAFYRSIFSGHHVAVSCLGSHKMFSPHAVNTVDHDYAIAFAKLVRMFNCLEERHLEEPPPSAQHSEIAATLMPGDSIDTLPTTTHFSDQMYQRVIQESELWREVVSACFGSFAPEELMSSSAFRTSHGVRPSQSLSRVADVHALWQKRTEFLRLSRGENLCITGSSSSSTGSIHGSTLKKLNQRRATLMQFSQLSTSGATPFSPFPYFRAHGQRDELLLQLFRRDHCTGRVKIDSKVSTTDAATLPAESNNSSTNTTSAASDSSSSTITTTSTAVDADKNAAAEILADTKENAPLILKDNSHICIWKPGVFRRHHVRLHERMLALFMPPVSVEDLSALMVEEIMSVVKDERKDECGTLKIIGAKSVAVWAKIRRFQLDKKLLQQQQQQDEQLSAAIAGRADHATSPPK